MRTGVMGITLVTTRCGPLGPLSERVFSGTEEATSRSTSFRCLQGGKPGGGNVVEISPSPAGCLVKK